MELARVIFRRTDSWSGRRHLAVVLAVGLALSVYQISVAAFVVHPLAFGLLGLRLDGGIFITHNKKEGRGQDRRREMNPDKPASEPTAQGRSSKKLVAASLLVLFAGFVTGILSFAIE